MAHKEENVEVGQRLRSWGLSKYTNLASFARALEISQVSLSAYMAGRSLPGNKLQSKLRDLDCDVTWLLTGKDPNSWGVVPTYPSIEEVPHARPASAQSGKFHRSLDFNSATHAWIRVSRDWSMPPFCREGSLLLVDLESPPKQDDIVLARLDDRIVIGMINYSEGLISVRPFDLNEKPLLGHEVRIVAFKVVVFVNK